MAILMLMLLMAAVLANIAGASGPVRASSGGAKVTNPHCTSMQHPLVGPGHGVAVCFDRDPTGGGWLELICISDREVAALFRAEWCERIPQGLPTRGRPMPVPR